MVSYRPTVSTVSDDEGPPSKKQVKFASRVKLDVYERDLPDPSCTWYSKAEYQQLRDDRAMDAARIRKYRVGDLPDTECFWGLENIVVPSLREKVMFSRASITNEVLSSQRHRRPVQMRALLDQSRWSAEVARKKALFYSSQVKVHNMQV